MGRPGRSLSDMTATAHLAQTPVRIDIDSLAPHFTRAMNHLDNAMTKELDRADIDHRLRELIRTRTSQINGCAYCVDTHSRDARSVGESEQRLYALPVWRETPFFTDRERAALAFTEVVARIADTHVPDEAYASAAEHFTEPEMAAIISLITMINAWNTLAVTTRAWAPTPADD